MNHKGTLIIKTERLILRKFRKEDVSQVYNNYGRDMEAQKYIKWVPCATLESTNEFIKMHLENYDSKSDFYAWGIEQDGKIIGSIGAFDIDEDIESCEIGYSLGYKYWGKGYITEAVKAVIKYLLTAVGFNRIYASCHMDNVGSQKVMAKAGMQYEGKLREAAKGQDNKLADLLLYAILKSDFIG